MNIRRLEKIKKIEEKLSALLIAIDEIPNDPHSEIFNNSETHEFDQMIELLEHGITKTLGNLLSQ